MRNNFLQGPPCFPTLSAVLRWGGGWQKFVILLRMLTLFATLLTYSVVYCHLCYFHSFSVF